MSTNRLDKRHFLSRRGRERLDQPVFGCSWQHRGRKTPTQTLPPEALWSRNALKSGAKMEIPEQTWRARPLSAGLT